MEISVSSILQSPQAVTRHPFSEMIPLDGESLLEPVTGEVQVTRASPRLIQVEGDFHGRLKVDCDRCGNAFELPVEFTLDEALEVTDRPLTSIEVEDTVPIQGQLDVTDLVRQALILSLPPRKLCGCEPGPQSEDHAETDPRWADLKAITIEPNGHPH